MQSGKPARTIFSGVKLSRVGVVIVNRTVKRCSCDKPTPAFHPLSLPVHRHQKHRTSVASSFAVRVRTTSSASALAVAVTRNGTARSSEIESKRPESREVGWPNLIEGQHVLQESCEAA